MVNGVFMVCQAAEYWQRLLQEVNEYLQEEQTYDAMAKMEDNPGLLESDDDGDAGNSRYTCQR